MKTLKILLPAVFVLSIVLLAAAQIFQIVDYRERTGAFLAGIIRGDIDKSCEEFIGNSSVSVYPERVDYYTGQIESSQSVYGDFLDYEFIREEGFGDSAVKLTYVIKAQQIPIIARFYFYRPANDWKLVNITFSNSLDFWPASSQTSYP